MEEYSHNQNSGATQWIVQHNLNTNLVAVDVFVFVSGVLTKILPDSIVVFDNNTLHINFSSSRNGYATVIGTANNVI